MPEWPFKDAENTAVFTLKKIVSKQAWIAQVWHDADDGAWQFLDADQSERGEDDAAVVSLEAITKIDPSVVVLADLPLGWCAWRDGPKSPWQRKTV